MKRVVWLPLLLGACVAHPAAVQQATLSCPPPVAVPAPLPHVRTPDMLAAFEVRVELAREAERARGDACAAAVAERDAIIVAARRR